PAEISILGQGDFTEGNAWHYRFFAPQDVNGHIGLLGGDSAYIAALDAMFDAPSTTADHSPDVSGLIGQYAHGNEPSHQVAYLYAYAGAPWRTQERVNEIKRTMYTTATDGLCGNEDCGQMSAWYVFSAMGFYPVTPGSGIYVLGTPTFERVEIAPAAVSGRPFVIEAEGLSTDGKNIYIQSAEWNGELYRKSYITQAMLDEGGKLVLHMGSEPTKDFGTDPADRPVARIPEEDVLSSAQMLAGVVFEPYIDDTARVFDGRLTLFPRCLAPQPRKIVYTVDGTEPTDHSPIAPIGGIVLTGDTEVKLRAITPDGRRSGVKTYRFYKSVLNGATVALEREPSAPYVNGGAAARVDGAMGGEGDVCVV
ncbi:MAG: glycoside hydrolase family 92 protein, partial [Rikenella sp.]|nr:glycoside hydrolase family 92 protein [Rikenella sp.]